ncbi:hypothetical protein ACFL2V_14480 [Pseudomonadota bacterium]
MASFRNTSNHSQRLTEIKIPQDVSTELHLVGVRAKDASEITLNIKGIPLRFSIRSTPHSGANGVWLVELNGHMSGVAVLESIFKGRTVASIQVSCYKKITVRLPDQATTQGMLCRLFLAHATQPSHLAGYNSDASRQSMLWMRLALQNRLSHPDPTVFGATAKEEGAPFNFFDIVRHRGQFRSFENYPHIDAPTKRVIDSCLNIANNYAHPARDDYAAFVHNAIAAAADHALDSVLDPTPSGLIAWREKGDTLPPESMVPFQELAGRIFYTQS